MGTWIKKSEIKKTCENILFPTNSHLGMVFKGQTILHPTIHQ